MKINQYYGCIEFLQKQDKKYLSINDASKLLGKSKTYLYKLIEQKKIKYVNLSSRIMLDVNSMLSYYQKLIEKNEKNLTN